MRAQKRQRRKRAGNHFSFTLIEMLTVITIVAVLVSLLFPALIAARSRTTQSTCLNNLRQLGVVVHIYLDDHKEIFPPSVDYVPWRGNDYPGGVGAMVNKKPQDIQACFTNYGIATNSPVWVCSGGKEYAYPANPAGLGKFNMPDGWGYRNNITYRWNSYETRSTLSMIPDLSNMNKYPKNVASIKKPAQAALMWDLPDNLSSYGQQDIHQGKINCLFVDGHIDLIRAIPGASTPNTLWWYVGDGAGEGWAD